jgi:hypothetical protein
VSFDNDLKRWIGDFVGSASDNTAVDAWVAHVLGRIVAVVPEAGRDAALQSVVRDACAAHWRSFLANLGQPEQTFHLVQEAKEVPVVVAQHGYALPVLFQIYTAGEQAVWEFITAAVKDGPPSGVSEADALVHFWTRSSMWFDRSVELSVALFQEEVERIRQGDAARRLEVVRAVLAGTLVDPREVSAGLGGHPVSAVQTALVLHTDDDARIADLPHAALTLTTSLGLRQPLVVHPGGRDLWAWISSGEALDLAPLASCADWLRERSMVATVGAPAPGVDGFRSSHSEALATQRLSLRAERQAPITYFTDVELMTLVGDNEATRRYVHRTLGRLASTDEQATRLRATLRTLLSTGNVDAAARHLSVHKNTVRYRVERAEELMGRRVIDDSTEIDVALRCHEMFIATSGAPLRPPAGRD